MASSYYYFVATLPGLRLGEAPPMTVAEFLARAAESMDETTMSSLEAAVGGNANVATEPATVRWAVWDRTFLRTLAALRAGRLGREAGSYAQSNELLDGHTRAALQECVKQDDPLKAEHAADDLRWAFLDEMAATHSFDFSVVLSYLLKLVILERWARFDAVKGEAMLQLCAEHAEATT